MKIAFVLFSPFLITLFAGFSLCNAEKIYRKDGKIIDADILYRNKGSIWIKHGSGAAGLDIRNINKIENKDGSVSKFGYELASIEIQGLIAQKKYKEAEKLCGLLLQTFPGDNQLHYLRGLLNQKIGNLEQAQAEYDILIKKGIADAQVFNNLGIIYAGKNKGKEAEGLFIKAIGKNPGMVEAHNNLADLLLQSKDYSRAIEEYNEVIGKEPGNSEALYNLGIAYMDSKNYPKAKEQWEKVLVINPQDSGAKNALEYLRAKKLL